MVCIRCVMVVKNELEKFGLPYSSVELGQAEIQGSITVEQHNEIKAALLKKWPGIDG